MKTDRTLEEIRREGLAALRQRLGVVGMVRFLQQFDHGEDVAQLGNIFNFTHAVRQ